MAKKSSPGQAAGEAPHRKPVQAGASARMPASTKGRGCVIPPEHGWRLQRWPQDVSFEARPGIGPRQAPPALASEGIPGLLLHAGRRRCQGAYRSTENRKRDSVSYTSPGRRMVFGKAGWFGESGKCWGSRQKPLR